MDAEQFYAASLEAIRIQTDELRSMKIVMLDVRDALAKRGVMPTQLELTPTAIPAPATATNGNGHRNGGTPVVMASAPPAGNDDGRHDQWGNRPVRGLSLENREGKSGAWIACHTASRGGRPRRLAIHFKDYGQSAYAYGLIVLRIFRGDRMTENLELLPPPLRKRVTALLLG